MAYVRLRPKADISGLAILQAHAEDHARLLGCLLPVAPLSMLSNYNFKAAQGYNSIVFADR
jgi:hypothetical protein